MLARAAVARRCCASRAAAQSTLPTVMRGIAAARHVKALLVDLDDTLYMSSAAHASVKNAIERFMIEHLGYENKDVVAATSVLWAQHGTTLAGLVAAGHRIHYDAWHAAVHHRAIDYDRLIAPDPQLRQVLQSVPLPKFILTNADRAHTQRCLQRLGVADCFQGTFDFEWAQAAAEAQGLLSPEHPILCKPNHQVYLLALSAMRSQGVQCEPSQVMLLDDSARNVQAAHELGLLTAIVGRDTPVPGADVALPTVHALPAVLPELLLLQRQDSGREEHARQVAERAVAVVEQRPGEAAAQMVMVAQGSGGCRLP